MLHGNNTVNQPASKEKNSNAPDRGAISFNTYDWNYAPYLLKLKHRIQKYIYPPAIFTQLGLGGQNIISFRIYPNGILEQVRVLDYSGEQSLVVTSKNAVTYAAPFPPLPDDFPEKYLEVTARFDYNIHY